MSYRLAKKADSDLDHILSWTAENFGTRAVTRYAHLLEAAFHAIAKDPELVGAKQLDLKPGLCLYHLSHVTKSDVKHPRHVVIYRRASPEVIEIVRILHERMDLERHF